MNVEVSDFLMRIQGALCIDVRSPSEYAHAHIPQAVNIPLLNDEQRKEIGTLYKKEGKEAAVKKGYELVGPFFVEKIEKILSLKNEKQEYYFYCWRGGLRSNIMAWLLKTMGKKVYLLEGGYKSFRNLALQIFTEKYPLKILGGNTGSGKTQLLSILQENGMQVIDLEGLAHHRGSAYGHLGLAPQPSPEMFENQLAKALFFMDKKKSIWVEGESVMIGKVCIPQAFFEQMKNAPYAMMQVKKEERIQRILAEYGGFAKEDLAACTQKIERKMGPQNCKLALTFLSNDELERWLEIVVDYYDKLYAKSMLNRPLESITQVPFTWTQLDLSPFLKY